MTIWLVVLDEAQTARTLLVRVSCSQQTPSGAQSLKKVLKKIILSSLPITVNLFGALAVVLGLGFFIVFHKRSCDLVGGSRSMAVGLPLGINPVWGLAF